MAGGHRTGAMNAQPSGPRVQRPSHPADGIVIPPSLLYGWMIRFFLSANLLLVWIGFWLMEHQWPGGLKLWLCTAMGIGAIAWSVVVHIRRRTLATVAPPEVRRVVPAIGALGVVALVLVEGAFITWVIWGPPHLL